MEDYSGPLNWPCFYQDEGIEDLRHYLLYTTELETAIVSAKEEITRREIEIFHLKDLISKAIGERNEAQILCQELVSDKLALQQLLQKQQENQLQQEMQHLKQESASLTRTYSSEDESKASDSNNHSSSPDSSKVTVPLQFTDTIPPETLQSSLPEVILKLAADKPLPVKGKLLQAVKEAGPLLQTLLLAGPLPQWQHPPPQLDSIEIPPVTISSPTARLIHQDSFNSFSSCLSKKRDLELCEGPDFSSPANKYQKVVLH
ncbi:PREDICTED: uncharacterized protein LOC105130701 [Populus euphratica]|uniref:Uncharacterized protein LOC105130701 n=1 Tax=Populus euphratica TaxID=75702 RepID=A0AAJ6UKK6_POPEU|nr:PREDICTED: uncharacterized protein LOC105130701 [Populus euphratica]